MSEERHPNINAAAWTTSILEAFIANLRGPAARHRAQALEVLRDKMREFVVDVSAELDMELGGGDDD